MTTFNDQVFHMGGAPLGSIVPFGGKSKSYFCDPLNGSDGFDGTTPATAKATLKAAYDLTTANQHDCVYFVSGATADNPATGITWSNSYTHLIGLSADLPGLGQRCRVVAAAAAMHTPVITFSGNGCVIKNMQFGNEHATGDACGVVLVTGQRNYFQNVFFMVPFSATAASYSLKITDGGENCFRDCTIGQHTCVRSAATHGLWIALGSGEANPTRNRFIHCDFLSWIGTAGHAHITIATDVTVEAFTLFLEDCLLSNINGGATMAHAIIDGATETHHRIYLRGNCMFDGNTTGMADPVTYVYSGCPLPVTPTTAVVAAH
jgi:hypothetical protein